MPRESVIANPASAKQSLSFFVPGEPAPQGSMRAIRVGRHARMISDNEKTMPWRATVSTYAARAMAGRDIINGPVSVGLTFVFPRIKSHYRKSGEVKPNAPTWKDTKPDIDKLERSVLDAMTGIVFADDGCVAIVSKSKVYTGGSYPQPGAFVRIEALS